MRKSPCKDCKDRMPTCRDYCDKWQKFEDYKMIKYAKNKLDSLGFYPHKERDAWGIKRGD